MEDLFVNFIGALVFSLIGYFSAKKQEKNRIIDNLVPRVARSKLQPEDGAGPEKTERT